ncbi:MAG: hypothetical protein IJG13_00600 [Kiritimatiellae bacterium]|nr:hypothetical protein [Kiritimatiellia bacterium]MBQ3345207.1 hypothetical protein [Kiritimatiellia bacterium]MBQ6329991.1 hypothetical protein [Kiritimatiellia bacterium]
MMLTLALIEIAVTLVIVAFGVVGFAAFFVMGIVDSSEALDESPHNDGEDVVWRMGNALRAILETPHACT